MDAVNLKIWEKFRIKRGDNLPLTGWAGTRDMLGELFFELGYKVGAEIGVQAGIFSAVLCKAIPGLKLYCVDPWTPFSITTSDQAKQDKYFEHAEKLLSPYNVEFIKKTSMEAVKSFADGSLDFVYIDGLHDFDNVVMDIVCWAPKVRSGGIVSCHDYNHGYQQGVVYAVDAYTRAHNIQLWYMTPFDKPQSVFWVR
jgi:predicted O-methyltransferase YrrM